MPIVFRYGEDSPACSGAVWHSTESTEQLAGALSLDAASRTLLAGFRSERRRREWLTVRNLLRQVHPGPEVPAIDYAPNGRPSLADGTYLSISHSGEFVTLVWSRDQRLGCDLEAIRPQIRRLSDKFLGEREKAFLGPAPSLESLHLVWGAKESLFKLYGLGGVDFRTELEVLPFTQTSQGALHGWIRKPDFTHETVLRYHFMESMLLVWTGLPA